MRKNLISDHFVFVSDFHNTDLRTDQRCLTPKTPDDHEWWCPYGIQIEIVPLPENGSSRKSSTSSRKSSHSKTRGLFIDEQNDCFVVDIDILFYFGQFDFAIFV